jgi:hypothetical protein
MTLIFGLNVCTGKRFPEGNEMRVKRKVWFISCLSFVCIACAILLGNQSFAFPAEKEIELRTNYLQRCMAEPLDEKSELLSLQNESSEFMLFACAYSAYAMTNLAVRDSNYRYDATKLIKNAIKKVLEPKISYPYNVPGDLYESDSIPKLSVLYLGHLNLMIGCYRLVSADTTYNSLNDMISHSLFKRFSETSYMCLESYSRAIWIPDNTVALASLKLHSRNTAGRYEEICRKWVDYAKKNFIDNETGVLFSTVNYQTGLPEEEPRGSMLGWSIMFIYQFNRDFALELYANYKEHFSCNLPAWRLFRERHNSWDFSTGDIDSGPIFAGFSIPANEFALANAVMAKDYKTAKKLMRLINYGTKTIRKNDELKYKIRFFDMNISPMAEALVLHALTITQWK